MSINDPRHHRPFGRAQGRLSIRLSAYDYANQGAYFVTICAQDRLRLFGEIVHGEMVLNPNGEIVKQELMRTPEIRREIMLDAWIIMPNHIHAIVIINEHCDDHVPVGATGIVGAHGHAPLREHRLFRKPKSLSSFVAGFKSSVTTRINVMRNTPGKPVWQRNYYEHIIRNDNSHETIRRYILENPLHWAQDGENPDRKTAK